MQTTEIVPKLRFKDENGKEFPEWVEKNLGDVGNTISGLTYSPNDVSNNGTLVLRSSNVKNGRVSLNDNVFVNVEKYNRVKPDDILICVRNGSRNLIGKNCLILKEHKGFAFGAFMTVFRSEMNRFLTHVFKHEDYKKQVQRNLGATINSINNNDLKKFKFLFPLKEEEEQKIASFLSSVDEKISQLEKKKTLLETYKRGIMQKIFSQGLRFKDENGQEFPEWKERKLDSVFVNHGMKSMGLEEVFSVSVHKGLINQIEHLGRVFAAKNTDNYNLVLPGDIVYTKSPTGDFPFGIIKQSKLDKKVIVSPLYAVFTPETNDLGYILDVYFQSPLNVKNYLHSIIQKGAKNTINITNKAFLSKKLLLPIDKAEQKKIASFLSSIDKKIEITSTQLKKTREFKKGLLQQMFV